MGSSPWAPKRKARRRPAGRANFARSIYFFAEGTQGMTLKRMDNVLIVVDDLETVKAFFIELGLSSRARQQSKGLRSGA